MANTFIQLNDVPSDYTGHKRKFPRVKPTEDGLYFSNVSLNDLIDVDSAGGYQPAGGQILEYSAGAGKWRPVHNDPYSAGNGLSKVSNTLNVVATGGLVANASGVYIADIANVSGTYGTANTIPTFSVNSKGQITDVQTVTLVADSAQTITDDFVASIQGMPGSIRVTGGTGNAANATVELVATGVTAATYGNATHAPQITVDSYGRIQNVDLVQIVATGNSEGGGDGVSATDAYNMHKYFKTVRVGGVRNQNNEVYGVDVAAEKPEDTLYIESLHRGLLLQPNSNTDSLNFDINSSEIAAEINLGELADVDLAGINNGDVLMWDAANSRFQSAALGGNDSVIDLTDFTVSIRDASGGGNLSYNNNGVFTFSPADLTDYVTQSELNAANAEMKSYVDAQISSASTGNIDLTGYATESYVDSAIANVDLSVDLTDYVTQSELNAAVANVNTDDQTITWDSSSNTLSISNGNSVDLSSLNVDLTGYATESYVNSAIANVNVDLTGYATESYVDSAIANVNVDLTGYATEDYVDSATANIDLTGYASESYVDSAIANVNVDLTGYATEDYVESTVQTVLGAANVDLNALAEVSNVLSNSNISAVAFSGDYNDLINRPSLNLNGTNLSYDGATVDLSGIVAQSGSDGIGVTSAAVLNNNLVLTLSDSSTIDAGNVRGPAGTDGIDGVGISSAQITNGDLLITYSNTTVTNVGTVTGPIGPKGDTGAAGLSISNANVNGAGNLVITLSDSSTIDAGLVKGSDGATPDLTGYATEDYVDSAIANVNVDLTGYATESYVDSAIANVNVDLTGYATESYVDSANTKMKSYVDAQISSVGSSNVDLTGYATESYVDSAVANVNVDLTGYATESYVDSAIANVDLTGYATEDYVANVINSLSVSDSQSLTLSGNTLSISGGNSVDLSGLAGSGGATTLADLTDVSATAATVGQVLKWDGSSWAPADDATGSGDAAGTAAGATIQRFKVNYTSNGQIAGITDATTGISAVAVNSAAGGEITVEFDSNKHNLPPGAITMYGYDHSNNVYVITPFESTMGLRQIPAGGSSGSPTLFAGNDTLQIQMRVRETETGASRGGFGTTTHAWIQFVMYE